jgi:chloramphenicol-sensitive protein RarD
MTNSQSQKGIYLALAAFIWWGLAPIYFKLLTGVDAFEIMAHRMIWSLLTLIPLMLILKKPFRILEIIKTPKLLLGMLATGFLISINWLIFVWAIANEQVLATSLG